MKDRQARAVRDFESRMWNGTVGHKVSLSQLQGLTDAVCEFWKVRGARVQALPKSLIASRVGDCGQGVIRLASKGGGRTGLTTAHEAAHHVCDELYERLGEEIEAHGPQWAAVFLVTLDAFHIMPMVAVTAAFKEYGIKTDDAIVANYVRRGKRASARLRKNHLRKKRAQAGPPVDGILAKGRFGGYRRGVDAVVFLRLHPTAVQRARPRLIRG